MLIPKPQMSVLLTVDLTDPNTVEWIRAWPEGNWICQCTLPLQSFDTGSGKSLKLDCVLPNGGGFHRCWCDTTPPGLTRASASSSSLDVPSACSQLKLQLSRLWMLGF